MSDLTATHCGCNNVSNNGCGSWIWIIILLFCCNGNNGCGLGGDMCNNNNGCDSIIWIILLLCCCGNNNNNGCC